MNILACLSLAILLACSQASAYVDMFMNANETSSLIGMSRSIFYVFNGELRHNSIMYHLDIPERKKSISISWRTSNLVNYIFKLTDLNSTQLHRNHTLSISPRGFVPTNLTQFALNFDCSSKPDVPAVNVQLQVYFDLNNSMAVGFVQLISMPPINFTIKYHKICQASADRREYMKSRVAAKSKSSFLIAYLIMGALAGFALLVGLVGLFMLVNAKLKAKQLHAKYESLHLNHEQQLLKEKQQQIINEKLKNKIYAKNSGQNSSSLKSSNPYSKRSQPQNRPDGDTAPVDDSNIYETVPDSTVQADIYVQSTAGASARPRINKEKLKLNLTTNTMYSMYNTSMSVNNLEKSQLLQPSFTNRRAHIEQCVKFQACQVEFGSVLVEGKFSRIYEGKLSKEASDQESTAVPGNTEVIQVLIKQVNDECGSSDEVELMLKESCAFRALKHKNLNTILGVCFDSDKKPFTLFHFCNLGNLKHYLSGLRTTKCKNSEFLMQLSSQTSFSEHPLISTQELLFIMLQLFKALNYLHGKHILHRDVATRNCWLDTNLSLKLSDCALSRDMFPDDYHCVANSETKSPVLWQALETLTDNTMNIQSEIWSCGVFLWECFSLAAQPYEDVGPSGLAEYLAADEANRLKKPANCPNELFDIYKKSWNAVPEERPTLKEIFYAMHKYYSNLDNYV